MSGAVKITIKRTVGVDWADRLFGTVWHWDAFKQMGLYAGMAVSGWAYTERGARRKGEKAARRLHDNQHIEYSYDPAGLK